MGNHSTIIKDVGQLVEWLAKGEKPAADWRIGTEHEKFLFHRDNLRPVAYDGDSGVEAMLNALCKAIGDKATPIIEKGKIIGLKDGDGGSVSLEPGGQLELSGAPLSNLHQTCAETGRHLRHMRAVSSALGVGMLGIGFQPKWSRDDIAWMPKGRYRIMRNHMPKVGTMGLDMMLRSCTVQVNLDYADEADMRRKFRTSLALQPVATALFANSPFKDGKPSGGLSGVRMSGLTLTMQDAVCHLVCSTRILAMNNGSIIFLMSRCIFCIVAKIMLMLLENLSAIIWVERLSVLRVSRRKWPILKTILPPPFPKCG